jgi:nicotinamide-nucleotide adenylyltransferase
MRRALYIGRFQVFHLGHLDVLRTIDAAADIDETVVAVGSSQYDHEHRSPVAPWSVNPFTIAERREMIERSLAGELAKPWSLHAVPDYHDWARWYRHIEERLPPFACLYSADAEEHAFFAARGKQVRGFPRRFAFHAGSLRRRLAAGDRCAAELPEEARLVLERIGAAERLRALFARDAEEHDPGGSRG